MGLKVLLSEEKDLPSPLEKLDVPVSQARTPDLGDRQPFLA